MKKVRFDTRDVKPKVWNILYLWTASFLTYGVISLLHLPHGILLSDLVILLALVLSIVFLTDALRKQLEYNPYSYNTIYYAAFTAFLTVGTFFHLLYVFAPDQSASFHLFEEIHSLSMLYAWVTTPFLVVFSAALIISNIFLIRYEGKGFVNLLGIILSLLILAGIWGQQLSNYAGSEIGGLIHDVLFALFESVFIYYLFMLIGTVYANIRTAFFEPDKDKDYIIVLGCGLRPDGTPTPLLRGRIERALRFYNEQIAETGKHPKFITSGGQGPDEAISESLSMKNWLLEQGVPEEDILMEDQSTNTYENMRNAKELIDAAGPSAKVIFSTSRYHVFRSGLMARYVKLKAQGIGADTKWYFWPNAAVREFIGLLTEHRGKQILILSGMILVNIAAAALSFYFNFMQP